MPNRSHCAVLAMATVLLLACKSDDTASQLTDGGDDARPAATSRDGSLPVDVVAECDQAMDGTACGDDGDKHCIYGVCASNLCGDGVRSGAEDCDDGNEVEGDACPADCRYPALCRDANVDEGEECDDGNRINDDACSNSCTIVECGNGRVDPGEECDDGAASDDGACSASCRKIFCGNGRVDPREVCDGATGCTVEGQACAPDCSACVEDRCAKCVEEKCSDFSGVDLLPGCRTRISELAKQGTFPPLAGFIEKCTALDDCIRNNLSCYLANPSAPGTYGCFCGNVDPAACQASDVAAGVCAQHYAAATGCMPGEGFNACVLGAASDLTLPAGWAYYLADCRYHECPEACGY